MWGGLMPNMNKREIIGLLIHIPVGLANVAIAWFTPSVAVIFGGGFLAYEITQGNQPHFDIKGWLWGIFFSGDYFRDSYKGTGNPGLYA